MVTDIRGLAVLTTDTPRQLREKGYQIWRDALRVYRQMDEQVDAHTPTAAQAGFMFVADAFLPANYTFTNDIQQGWFCEIVQVNVGAITCVAGTGATVNGLNGIVATQGPWDVKRVTCIRNTDGKSAEFVVS